MKALLTDIVCCVFLGLSITLALWIMASWTVPEHIMTRDYTVQMKRVGYWGK